MGQIKLRCGTLKQIEYKEAPSAPWVASKLTVRNITVHLIYDYGTKKLAIREWYRLTKEEILSIEDEVKAYFERVKR